MLRIILLFSYRDGGTCSLPSLLQTSNTELGNNFPNPRIHLSFSKNTRARVCVSGSDNTSAIHDAVYRCPRMRRGIDESKCNFARCSAANLRELGLGCREYAYRIPIGTATAKGVLVHPRVLIQQTISRGTYGTVFLLVQLDTHSRIPFHEIFTRDATQFRRLWGYVNRARLFRDLYAWNETKLYTPR